MIKINVKYSPFKKVLAVVMSLVLVFSMAVPGFAAYDNGGNGDNGTCNGGTATEQTATPSDLPTTETQTTSPAGLATTQVSDIVAFNDVSVSTFEELHDQIALGGTQTITITDSFAFTGSIPVTSGANITLLAGHPSNQPIILTAASGTRQFSVSGGTLTLGQINNAAANNIVLQGVSPQMGGGIIIWSGGQFIMNGGSITGINIVGDGASVNVAPPGTFIMNGGNISGNTSTGDGDNVHVNSGAVFTHTGGTIANGIPTISPVFVMSHAAGTAFTSTTPTATSSVSPITWVVASGSLPSGVTLNANTGVVTGTAASTAGTFTIRARTPVGDSPEAITVVVTAANQAPSITTHPTSQTVQAGSSVTFNAAATGVPTPTLQWQVSTNGGATFTNISGETSATLTLTNVTTAMNGNQYRVVVSNTVDSATSSAATLTVNRANQTAPTGLTPTHETAANANDGIISGVTSQMEWQAQGASIWTAVTGTTITGLAPGIYHVRYAETANHNASPHTVVTINPWTAVFVPVTGITNVPTSGTPNTAITLPLLADPATATNRSVVWTIETQGGTASALSGANNNVLTATSAGTVTVRATVVNGATVSTNWTNTFYITIATDNIAPSITTQPANQSVEAGQNATFTVVATGVPAPTFQWEVNSGSGWTNVAGATNATLTLNSVTMGMNGNQYRVVVTNTVDSATSSTVTLTVTAANHAITIQGGGTGASISHNQAAANTTITINAGTRAGYNFNGWTASPSVAFANANSTSTTFVMPNNAVTITANWTAQITYTPSGNDYSEPDPTNAQTPRITTQPQASTTAYIGDNITLSVTVANITDGGTLSYQWQRATGASGGVFRDIPYATDRTYSPDTTTAGVNRYRVIVTNTNNAWWVDGNRTSRTTSQTATVTVNAPAVVTPDPTLPTVYVELSPTLRAELMQLLGDRFSDLDIIINTSRASDINGGILAVDVAFAIDSNTPNAEELTTTLNNHLPQIFQNPNAYYTIAVDLFGYVAAGMNYHRIVAFAVEAIDEEGVQNEQVGQDADPTQQYQQVPPLIQPQQIGTLIGGGINRQGINQPDMLFTVNANTTGAFVITYVATLNRLALSLNAYTIVDLAGNAPTQTMDVLPFIQDNRTLIPVRFIAEALGAEVDWTRATDYAPSLAHITLNGQTLSFPTSGIITPELAALGMDVPPQVVGNRTMMPLRFVSEFFGAIVNWDDDLRSIEIISIGAASDTTPLTEASTTPNGTSEVIAAVREDEEETLDE